MSKPRLTAKEKARSHELRALKDEHELTYPEFGERTGYHEISLAQWVTGGKPLKERTLRAIRLMLAEHAKNGTGQSA